MNIKNIFYNENEFKINILKYLIDFRSKNPFVLIFLNMSNNNLKSKFFKYSFSFLNVIFIFLIKP